MRFPIGCGVKVTNPWGADVALSTPSPTYTTVPFGAVGIVEEWDDDDDWYVLVQFPCLKGSGWVERSELDAHMKGFW